jgi:hypothetical protein
MTEESLGIVIHARLIAFMMSVNRAKDIPSEIVSWLTWKYIGMRCEDLARHVVCEMKTSVVVNEKPAAVKELGRSFMLALFIENHGIRGVTILSHSSRLTWRGCGAKWREQRARMLLVRCCTSRMKS